MLAKCLKDVYGNAKTGLMLREQEYDIDPHDPWAIHFDLPKEAKAIAVAEHRKRLKLAAENRKKALAKKESGDEFDEEEVTHSDPAESRMLDHNHDEELKKFACDQCAKEFTSAVGLRTHVVKTHKRKPGFKREAKVETPEATV